MKILSVILISFGVFVTFLNYIIPVRFYILKKRERSYSLIPVIGGLFCFVGMLVWGDTLKAFSLIPLFIDIGCLPMILCALFKIYYAHSKK